jgi:hypothetical protein
MCRQLMPLRIGLRIAEKSEALHLFHGARAMRESVPYIYIFDEGRICLYHSMPP